MIERPFRSTQYPISFHPQEASNREDILGDIIKEIQLPKDEDPWGENIHGILIFIVSDSHIPREIPEHEPTILLQPYRTISRLDPRNPRRYLNGRQTRYADTWSAEVQQIKQQLEFAQEILKSGFIPLVVHLGDRGADAASKEDMQNALWTIGSGIRSLNDEDPRVKVAILSGDHEFDQQRHGIAVAEEEMRLLGGRPAFFQRIGSEHLLLGIATSLTSPVTDQPLLAWKQKQESLIINAALIASQEKRRVILLGHKEPELLRIADRYHVPIEAVFSGHKHIARLTRDRERGNIFKGTVGAPTIGGYGLELNIKPSFIQASIDDKGGVRPTLIKADPEKINGLI